jgi:glycosyltransferase 2 family protein
VSRAAGVARVALGSGVLGWTTVRALRIELDERERAAFDAVNSLPDSIAGPLWPVMQLGSLAAVPVVAGAVYLRGDHSRAVRLLVSGSTTWVLAKGVKRLVRRGRPAAVLPEVRVRGGAQSGDGFLSGHAAISAALASGLAPTAPGAAPWLTGVAATVAFSRVYVGAHLPLDVLGGAALGLIVNGLIELAAPS